MWQISIFFYKSIYARFKKQLPESASASAVDTGSKHIRLQSSGIRKQLPNQCMLITISTLCVNALQCFSEVKLNIFSWGLIILLSLQPVYQIKIIMKKEFKWHWWTAEVINVLSDIFSTNNLHRAAFLQCTSEIHSDSWHNLDPLVLFAQRALTAQKKGAMQATVHLEQTKRLPKLMATR